MRVWDGVAPDLSAPATLRIEDGRISGIGTAPSLARGARAIDLGGAAALPGLIDAHVHVTLDPAIGPPEAQLEVPPERVREQVAERAEAMLRAGITTARDLGGGAGLEIELRDRIARGELPGPRLLCAGQPVTSPRGHCWFWGGEAATPDEIRAVVRRQCARGADWIKVMATGGLMTRGTRAREAQFSEEEMRCAVEEARAGGLPVAAHCHGTAGIRRARAAGARTIEHCSWAGEAGFGADFDEPLARDLARVGVWVSPTVNAGWRRFLEPGPSRQTGERLVTCLRRMRALGVRLIASTDAGIPGVAHDRLPAALTVLARVLEAPPSEVLRAATSESAAALDLAGRTGRLSPGLDADVLVVDGDPLADLGALERPVLVAARGRLALRPAVRSSGAPGQGRSSPGR